MSLHSTLPLLLTLACGANPRPPAEAPVPEVDPGENTDINEDAIADAVSDAPDEPGEEAGEEAGAEAAGGDVSCEKGESVVLLQRRAPIRGTQPGEQALSVYDNGYWELTGAPDSQSGCLSEAELGSLQEGIAAADISAPPLPDGMARCMAMPNHTVTVEARGEVATWSAPCGPTNPSDSLRTLLTTLKDMTISGG